MEGASPLPLAERLQQRVGERQAGSVRPTTLSAPPEPEPEPEQLDDERSQRPRDAAMETRETPPKRRPPGHLEPRQLGLPPPSSPPPLEQPAATASDGGSPSTPRAPNWAKLTVRELRVLLGAFGLPADGSKGDLVERLAQHTAGAAEEARRAEADAPSPAAAKEAARAEKAAARAAAAAQREALAARRAQRPQIVSFDIETTIPRYRYRPSPLKSTTCLHAKHLLTDNNALGAGPA